MPTLSRTTMIVLGTIGFLISTIFWFPIDHQTMYVQGYFWKQSIDVVSSPVIQGEGSVLPKGAIETSREIKFDRAICPTREDDCVGDQYTWYKYTLTFPETIETKFAHGYDQHPYLPNTSLIYDGVADVDSAQLYLAVYFVDARGDLFVWTPKNLKEFERYDIKSSYVGTYNLLGWLLSVK